MQILKPRDLTAPMDVQVHVIIPFYNCEPFLMRCFETLRTQTHRKINVVVIDDASDDGSSEFASAYCMKRGWTYYRNEENLRCPYNLWLGVQKSGANPWNPIFLLDGDDYLPHDNVMARIAELYSEDWCWLIYGQYMAEPSDANCAPAIPPPYQAVFSRGARNHPRPSP
jgi:glycosyltransferase involved in cell wall biosynthesis